MSMHTRVSNLSLVALGPGQNGIVNLGHLSRCYDLMSRVKKEI